MRPKLIAQLPRLLLAAAASLSVFAIAADGSSGALQKQYSALSSQLRQNDFGRPIVIESAESPRDVRGEVYAVFDHPFEKVKAALSGPTRWCDVLLLPINSRSCRLSSEGSGHKLMLGIANKNEHNTENLHTVLFNFSAPAAGPSYFASQLHADAGPLGTSNYRILLEAVPVESGRTFLHLTYSYSYGVAAKLAMQAYLGTAGRGKVGFSTVSTPSGAERELVAGTRGVIERNTMRYYLAIEAFLATLDSPAGEQMEKRLNKWFNATEQYPRQLRELSRAEYLELKRADHRRVNVAS